MKHFRFALFFMAYLILPLAHAGALIIGTTGNSPPFASRIDKANHFMGFEIDIMNAICQRIQAQCNYQPVIVSDIATAVQTGKINLAIAAIIIPPPQLNDFIYSLPYLQSNAQFMASKVSGINKPNDIRGKRVGVRRGTLFGGTLFKDLALNIYDNQLKIVDYPNMADLVNGLKNNDIDAAFSNAASMRYWSANSGGLYQLIGSQIPVGNGYGIMAKKGQDALMAKINHALLSMESDGSYLDIYTRYF